METNKLIAVCAAVAVMASLGIAEEALACGGAVYSGPFNVNNEPDGLGTLTYPNGNVLEGTFKNGRITAITDVKVMCQDGTVYEGAPGTFGLLQSTKVVEGRTIYRDTQNLIGEYPSGHGTITYRNGEVFKGFYLNGKPKDGLLESNFSDGERSIEIIGTPGAPNYNWPNDTHWPYKA